MNKLKIVSKTFGTHYVILDDEDYQRIIELGGKWCLSFKRGRYYPQKRLSGNRLVEMHRYLLNPPNGKYVDHINHDTLDNRRSNLRVCSNASNLRNGIVRSNNSSGVTGVRWDKERMKWQAKIKVNYKDLFLGRFINFEDAVEARKIAEKKYWSV